MMDILQNRKIKNMKNKTADDTHYISEFTFSNSFNYKNLNKKENTMVYHKKLSNYKYFKQNERNKIDKINKCISQINIFRNNPFEEKEKIKSN